jgi:hypothetical protein
MLAMLLPVTRCRKDNPSNATRMLLKPMSLNIFI